MFNLSTQALMFGVLLLLLSIITIIAIIYTRGPVGILYSLLFCILSIPMFALLVYEIDCLTSGNCNLLSWAIVLLAYMWFAIMVIMFSIFAAEVSENSSSDKTEENTSS